MGAGWVLFDIENTDKAHHYVAYRYWHYRTHEFAAKDYQVHCKYSRYVGNLCTCSESRRMTSKSAVGVGGHRYVHLAIAQLGGGGGGDNLMSYI